MNFHKKLSDQDSFIYKKFIYVHRIINYFVLLFSLDRDLLFPFCFLSLSHYQFVHFFYIYFNIFVRLFSNFLIYEVFTCAVGCYGVLTCAVSYYGVFACAIGCYTVFPCAVSWYGIFACAVGCYAVFACAVSLYG